MKPACATSVLPAETWDADVLREGRKAKAARIATAKAVCDTCPIRRPCGQLADDRRDIGVWGGTYRGWNPARLPRMTHDIAA
ncbi:WhiB family transcriptional regulator [Blastococcus sp. BMG 814]|uniref:WhiB family transcriptional regulator n=1 Tax=Blastococcus carthaginiensis TaxID=3050034 RepID=A0ABT9I9B3_9ACTN|nr:WhiB family transcriptional regulator [Blastococcus carthaginiensis]MDP5182162.1 WhiB family transcriptional regulator [Blastococcus carthaginiensis]